jgi:hypothetical protein
MHMKSGWILIFLLALVGCAGTPRLPECRGVSVPINAPVKATHGG